MDSFNDSGYFPGNEDLYVDLEGRLVELEEKATKVKHALQLVKGMITTIEREVEQDEGRSSSKKKWIASVERLAKVYFKRNQLQTAREQVLEEIQKVYDEPDSITEGSRFAGNSRLQFSLLMLTLQCKTCVRSVRPVLGCSLGPRPTPAISQQNLVTASILYAKESSAK
ncbi:hypothetical protein CAPTEDRAFT_203154 [Capitella teleta]|uniref:Uncharacterized protein n=1 Tax=Capitella teleta TaxID=283909 RepID=R7TFU5_CAPTE|nr:hypothetical protein CAPTEDRAFT_203154 [Capitella teleta]|eukprot:ELT89916.1 hypothetical protein CAPTEDRAFT_203154 [Capitella teleta]